MAGGSLTDFLNILPSMFTCGKRGGRGNGGWSNTIESGFGLLVFLAFFFEISFTLKLKKSSWDCVNSELNCFGVVGVSYPIKI